MISDQLRYINVAKEWFTVDDLIEIRRRKLGTGRIGGKAAGMLLAVRILKRSPSEDLQACLRTPDSYFIGSDVFYTFMSINNLVHWNDQKYKTEDEMRAEYPANRARFRGQRIPARFSGASVRACWTRSASDPLIVRSSSLLEDNFGTSFAGKYESVFCPTRARRQKTCAR